MVGCWLLLHILSRLIVLLFTFLDFPGREGESEARRMFLSDNRKHFVGGFSAVIYAKNRSRETKAMERCFCRFRQSRAELLCNRLRSIASKKEPAGKNGDETSIFNGRW
jgi:hypothetical protein